MALKQANVLAPANTSSTGYALADARHIGGHRVVATLAGLYALQDWQLLNPDETDTELAVGQQWYVKGTGIYRLTNWGNRKSAAGWTRVVDPNNIDTTLFQIVAALPTTGINKNRLYLVKSASSTTQDIYDEYLYTGDTTAAYDASKWEKLGEYQPKVDLTPYSSHIANKSNPHGVTKAQVGLGNVTNEAQIPLSQKGAASGVATLDASGKVTDAQLWDATEAKHGLMSASDKESLDTLASAAVRGDQDNVLPFDGILLMGISLQTTGIDQTKVAGVLYSSQLGTFVAKGTDGKYYGSWGGSKYGTDTANGVKPVTNKLYNLVPSGLLGGQNTLYRYNGKELVPVSNTVDTSLSDSSANPIANNAVKTALDTKVDKADIEVMTTDEVDALFA